MKPAGRIVIDFETYYSQRERYTLSSMTAVEYIMDPRFQIICVSAKLDEAPVRSWSGHEIQDFDAWLSGLPTDRMEIVAHNGIFFDFLILGWHFGIRPLRWTDTMLMSRPLVPRGVTARLGDLAQWLGLPPKGDEVLRADGKRLEAFSPTELHQYQAYCNRDVDISARICDRLKPLWQERDLLWMHLCCNMGAYPSFVLDRGILQRGMAEEVQRHLNIYRTLAEELAAEGVHLPPDAWRPSGPKKSPVYPSLEQAVKKSVSSTAMCAQLLESLGEYVPTKYSEKQEARIPALSKTDQEFTEMADSDRPVVRALAEARLASKSSIRMSRLKRLDETALLTENRMPVFLEPFAASTGRNAGKQKMNIQNFSSRKSKSNPEGKANPLRRAMRAPEGHVVVDIDSSQIEVRVLGALTGEPSILEPFKTPGGDVYSSFGTQLYGYPVSKDPKTKRERDIAKSCVLGNGYGQGGFGFQRYVKVTAGLHLTLEEAEGFVRDYRRLNPLIVQFWRMCDQAVQAMMAGRPYVWGQNGCLRTEGQTVILPSGRRIYYRELQWRDKINPLDGNVVGREAVYYDPRKREWRRLHGPLMTENLCQATAADIINTQAGEAFQRWRYCPAAQVHDALVYVVPEDEHLLSGFLSNMRKVMSTTPEWLPFVQLACEAEIGPSYGEMRVAE